MKSFAFVVCVVTFAGCDSTAVGPTRILETNQANAKKLPLPAEPAPPVDAPVLSPPVPPAAPGVPYGAGTTSAKGLCQDIQQSVSCLVLFYGNGHALVLVTNSSSSTQAVSMESFALGVPDDFAHQTIFDAREATFPAGGSGTLEVSLPGCGYQLDVHLGPKVNFPPHPLNSLLGFEKEGRACEVPPVVPPLPPVDPPEDPPLTDCNAGVVDRSFVQGSSTATATFRILPGYAVRLWAAGYQRLTDGWDQQRFLGGVPPTTYTAGVHVLTVPAAARLQADVFCGGPDLYGQDVTPENIDQFNALHDAFAFFVVED